MSDEVHAKLDRILRELTSVNARLDAIEGLLLIEGKLIMSALDDLTAQVAAVTSVEQSAVTLIEGLAAKLAAAGTDPAKLTALQDSLKASSAALSAAILANTPAAPPSPAPVPAT